MTEFSARLRALAEEMIEDGDDYVYDYGKRLQKMLAEFCTGRETTEENDG